MKTSIEEYNDILSDYNIICLTEDDYINKRKNYTHKCFDCNKIFRTTPYKLLKNIECPDKLYHVVETRNTLTTELYLSSMPFYKKLKDKIIDLKTPVRHKCMRCKNIFRISPEEFYKSDYKCPVCNNGK